MGLPTHTHHLVERLMSRYCAGVCPPSFERQVRLGYRIEGRHVLLHEIKPIFGIPGTSRAVDTARFSYRAADGTWRLAYSRDEPARWRPYPGLGARVFARLLAEVDTDPLGLFWGRVNGASLRWCSARGRCAACESGYRSILGLDPQPGPSGPADYHTPAAFASSAV